MWHGDDVGRKLSRKDGQFFRPFYKAIARSLVGLPFSSESFYLGKVENNEQELNFLNDKILAH